MNKYIEQAEQDLLHTYNRFPVVFEKGEGVYLYDTDGKEYLDFAAGIGVCSLGYQHPEYTEALKAQIDKLLHVSNLYYTDTMTDAAAKLKKAVGMERVFFTNSGTEAVEGALKAARKAAWGAGKKDKTEFIAMEHSFHGRSMGALSVTGNENYRTPFEPLIGGVKFARFNDLDSVKELISEQTCGLIVEPVQGEGGVYPADKEFLAGLRKLCDQYDVKLIFDEIQCGMGRTGTLFAWQGYGVKPDIVTMAKGIGGGVPVGAFAMTEEMADMSLQPGEHGTTYGGNPLACAAVSAVADIFEEEQIISHVQQVSAYMETQLDELAAASDVVIGRRGKGLMQGLVLSGPAGTIISRALEEGLVVVSAGANVIRFLPPLVITKAHVDQMIIKLKKSLTV